MKNFFGRVRQRIRQGFDIASLGATPFTRARLLVIVLWRSFERLLGFDAPNMPHARGTFRLTKDGTLFELALEGSLEELMLLRQIMVSEIYRCDYPAEPKVIFDCGASMGITSIYFRIRYPRATIYAFEPNPVMYKRLAEHARQFANIIPSATALSGAAGKATFFIPPFFEGASLVAARSPEYTEVSVETETLDGAMRARNVPFVDIIKFDIEGAELDVFRASARLGSIGAIVGELHPDLYRGSVETFLGLFRPFMALTTAPTDKKDRYIVYGVKKDIQSA